MGFPIKTCVVCEEEFELKPNHAGYANRCPDCNAPKQEAAAAEPSSMTAEERRVQREADAERRRVIREMLYSKK